MLARTPVTELGWTEGYDGFPFWEVLLTQPGQERKAAERIEHITRGDVTVYWPHYTNIRPNPRRPGTRIAAKKSVLPCVLLSPVGALNINRLAVLSFANVKPATPIFGRYLSKREVEIIREMAAECENGERLKAPSGFRIGQRVRFLRDMWCAFLGEGTILGLAKSGRVSVRIDGKLFGGKDVIVVPAAELEAI